MNLLSVSSAEKDIIMPHKKHLPATMGMIKLAKKYGIKHGFTEALGGWIYNKNGYPVVHGWSQFWYCVGGLNIRLWAEREGIIKPGEKLD